MIQRNCIVSDMPCEDIVECPEAHYWEIIVIISTRVMINLMLYLLRCILAKLHGLHHFFVYCPFILIFPATLEPGSEIAVYRRG